MSRAGIHPPNQRTRGRSATVASSFFRSPAAACHAGYTPSAVPV